MAAAASFRNVFKACLYFDTIFTRLPQLHLKGIVVDSKYFECARERGSETPKSHTTTRFNLSQLPSFASKSNSNEPVPFTKFISKYLFCILNVQGSAGRNPSGETELLHDMIFLTFFTHVDGLEVLDEDLPSFWIDNQPAVGVAMHNLNELAAVVKVLHVLIVC